MSPANTENSDIELTEDEIKVAIDTARQRKMEIIAHNDRKARYQAIEQEIARVWNSNDMLNYAAWRCKYKIGKQLVIDSENHFVLQVLCRYFTGDKRFEKMGEGWSLNKGIMLCGNVGSGKTFLMEAFNQNKRGCYKVITTRKMASLFTDIGDEILYTYSRALNVPRSVDSFFQTKIGICFDDLGTERQGKRYGDTANVMEQIILNKYEQKDVPYYLTHITTNLTADEIEQCYGTRVRSRAREMFNMVVLNGPDRRG